MKDAVEKTNKHRGSTLESFLEEEGVKDELKAIVTKERIAFQLPQAMKKKRITKVKLAAPRSTASLIRHPAM
jgi:antitoxin HicB